MFSLATKRFSLPFSNARRNESILELAAVFAVVELSRNRGGGLFRKQPEEQLRFLAKIGYPLWLFPRNDAVYVFDGLDDSVYNLGYLEMASAKACHESLEANLRPRESYMAFLADHRNYFSTPKEQQFSMRGLLAEPEFRREFSAYRKDAVETAAQTDMGWLLPMLDETSVSATLSELDKLQAALREDAQQLPECIRLINKTTAQYLTELDYETAAAVEEVDAKIKAQEELTNPQIAQLNKDYKRKIDDLTDSFDHELETLAKQKNRVQKAIEDKQYKIQTYEAEAKEHAKKGHEGYKKHWKEKVKLTKKELGNYKKDLKPLEGKIRKAQNQKTEGIAKLYADLDEAVKFARQPLLQLQISREAKTRIFKEQTQRLMALEKPVLEGLNQSLKLREAANANFAGLTIKDPQLKAPSIIYVPFYVACYEAGLARRYHFIPPSTVSNMEFVAKLRGPLGMSKTKELLTPRYRTVAALIEKLETYANENSTFEIQLSELAQKNNFLMNQQFVEGVTRGLEYLLHQGWVSEGEHAQVTKRLIS
jgi:hypothetical protein